MDTLWQDIRFSLRMLRRNPSFTFVAVFILALGVAATTAIATVVSAVLLHDLPYPDAGRLLVLEQFKNQNGELESFPSSYLDYQDWRTKTTSFADLGAHSYALSFNLLTDGEPHRVDGEIVDSSYFRLLKIKPALGRALLSEDDSTPGEPRIVVLSYTLWQSRFGRDTGVIGKSLVIDGEAYEIVGVMPERFQGLTNNSELWLPLSMGNDIMGNSRFLERRGVRWLNVVARLRPEVSLAQAQREMDIINAALSREHPESNEHMIVRLKTLEQSLFGDLRFPLITLFGASVFVLLIAWTTVANLLLARATARQLETAVRNAMGATRLRLIRQLATESVVLSGISCTLGLLIASWSTNLLVTASAVKFQSFVNIGLNLQVVTTIVALSLACGIGFGLTPAWFGVRSSFGPLRQSGGLKGISRHRVQSALVVAEVALALFLLVGAGLMVKGFQRFRQTDLGFNPRDLLTLRLDLTGKRYADTGTMTRLARRYRERLQAIPGVKTVSIEAPVMPTDNWYGNSFVVEDLLSKTEDGVVFLIFHHVTPGYFKNLGIPLLRGRDFTDFDTATSVPVIIISESMARKYWPGESPIGKRMRFGKRDPNAPWFSVVGVVGNLNHAAMQDQEWPGPDVYFAIQQFPPLLVPRFTFLIRPEGVSVLSLISPIKNELRAISPELPPYDAETMENRLAAFTAKGRFLVILMGLFACIALVLAAVGLYGVLFYSVTQQRRELGIRMALGAQPRDVLRLVISRAARLSAFGLAIGLGAAAGLNRLFQSLLYGVSPTDLLTLLATSLLLLLVAMAATYFPARSAMKIQPTVILRKE